MIVQKYLFLGIMAVLIFAAGIAAAAILFFIKKTAYLNPVKRELKKEKQWLRRGEFNAAMVKGRQNLELLLKLVAENNGIQLDNTAQAVANAKTQLEKNGRRNPSRKNVMTHQQFGWWMEENGYLDRVAKWEMNEVRVIGNKAVHENFSSKEEAWTQFNYLEDILKTVAEKHAGHKRKHARNNEYRPGKQTAAQKPRQNTKKTNTQSAKPQSGQPRKQAVQQSQSEQSSVKQPRQSGQSRKQAEKQQTIQPETTARQSGQPRKQAEKQQTVQHAVQSGKAARQSGQSRKQPVKQPQSEQPSVKQPRQSGQPKKPSVKQQTIQQTVQPETMVCQSGQPKKRAEQRNQSGKQAVKQPQPSENKAAGAEKVARRRYYPRHRRTSGKGQTSNLVQ